MSMSSPAAAGPRVASALRRTIASAFTPKIGGAIRRKAVWGSALFLAFAAALSAQSVSDYVIGPQDVLTIQVFDQADLGGKYTVETDGTGNPKSDGVSGGSSLSIPGSVVDKIAKVSANAENAPGEIAARLIDEMHIAVVPILLGRGVRLWDGLEGLEKDYEIESTISPSGVTHVTFTRTGA